VRGIATVFGDIPRADADVEAWCRSLGFTAAAHPDDPDLVSVRKALGAPGTSYIVAAALAAAGECGAGRQRQMPAE
jgi:hypothetical protein